MKKETKDELAAMSMTDLRRCLNNNATVIEQEMWTLINKLKDTAYDSVFAQLQDAVRVGDLARSALNVRDAANRL